MIIREKSRSIQKVATWRFHPQQWSTNSNQKINIHQTAKMWRKSAPFAPPCGEISKLLIGDWKLQAADGSAVSYPLPPARHFHPNLPAIIHESERDGKEEGEGYKKETPQSKATLNSEGGKSQKQTTTKIKRLWNNRVQKFGLRQRRYDGGRRCHFPPSSKFFPHGVINTSVTFLRLCPCGIPQRRSLRLWDFERNGQKKKKFFLSMFQLFLKV